MALRPQVFMAMILAVVILSLPVPPSWSLALIISFVAVFYARKTRSDTTLPVSNRPSAAAGAGVGVNGGWTCAVYPPVGAPPKTRSDPTLPVFNRPSAAAGAWFGVNGGRTSAVDPPVGAPPSADVAVGNPESSSTLSSSFGIEYEVFLSFRGPDTRYGFADFLYHALEDAGIRVFKDTEGLLIGEELSSLRAIKQARISIAILSRNYASSKWCLSELEEMLKCRELNGQIVLPIFYDVDPSDVRYQKGEFGRPFNLHEIDRVGSSTIEKWKGVLRRIADLKGYHRTGEHGRSEAQLVKDVVADVLQVLLKDELIVTNKLVGIDCHVQEMMRMLGVAYSKERAIEVQGEEVRVVGICGVPGVGKTTLAKVLYNKMHKLFDACSFLEGISSERVEIAQQKLIGDLLKQKLLQDPSSERIAIIPRLIRTRKVLIVLDDVREDEEIKALIGKLFWFHPGSRIIVTTNKKNVLQAFNIGAVDDRIVKEYKIGPMSDDDAWELFRKHAFQEDAPKDVSEYDSLSRDIAKAIGGIPLDIVRHASFLRYEMNIDIWKSTLDLLQKRPQDRQAAFQDSHAGASEHEDSDEDNQLAGPSQDSSINQSPSVSKASKLRRYRSI